MEKYCITRQNTVIVDDEAGERVSASDPSCNFSPMPFSVSTLPCGSVKQDLNNQFPQLLEKVAHSPSGTDQEKAAVGHSDIPSSI